MKRPVLAVLAALNIALALALAAMWVSPQGQWRNIHWTRPAPIQPDFQQMLPPLPGAPQPVSGSTFLALLERPMFSSTRRPPPPPPPPAPAAPPDLLADAQVLGTYQSGEASGIIARIEGKSRRIRLNESLNGWQLRTVHERAAIFTNGGQTRELPLLRAKIGSSVADPSARAAPPANAPIAPSSPPASSAPEGESLPQAQAQPPATAAPAATQRKSRFGP
ncbi:MAG: hypothetical protein JSS01_18160 [Proteobacteria bacterium]|nr:hypothetical protein [Pseudomonadota bacterium]